MADHEAFLHEHVIPWASETTWVRGVAELGSRARTEPADEWADMDLLLLVSDVSAVLDDRAWLADIGPVWLTVRHPGPLAGFPVRQVLFEDGLDFDLVPVEAGALAPALEHPGISELVGRGMTALVDKDGEFASVVQPSPPAPLSRADITAEAFDFVVQDFLFQCVWASKHLRRGELWAAKDDVDSYMKDGLLRMIEWHTTVRHPDARIRNGGRYLERWADDRIQAELPATFASYHAASVAGALLHMASLFRWVSRETAAGLGFSYPSDSHDAVVEWMTACLSPLFASPG